MSKKITAILTFIMLGLIIFGLTVNASNVSSGILHNTSDGKTAYVFIGDSRTTGMDRSINLAGIEDTFVVAKSGMGYNWFMKEGSEELFKIREENEDKYSNWVYIFNLGVNDLSNVDNYKRLYKELCKEATVYYLSINPTDDSVGGVQCEDIEAFNKEIYMVAYNDYINSYQYLTDVAGYTFDKRKDGMHYSDETYNTLYDFIKMAIDVREFVNDNDGRYSAFYYLYNVK